MPRGCQQVLHQSPAGGGVPLREASFVAGLAVES